MMKLDLRMPSLDRLKPKRPKKSAGPRRELAVPAPLRDLYGDLRDRRLLPLLAFLVVAIIAVPFLLGEKDELAVPPPASVETADVGSGEGDTLTVVQATPGLRDYRKRLEGRKPKNPFIQQHTGIPAGAKLQSTTTTGTTEVTSGGGGEVTVPAPSPGPMPPSGRGGGSGDGPVGSLYAYRPTIRFGIAGSGDLNVRRELPVGTLLPNKNPVVIFLGISEDGKRATFSVAREVAFVRGDGRCIGGPNNCGLLLLKKGEAADLLTGKPNRDFRLSITSIDFVELEEMTKANSSSGSGTAPRIDFSQSFSK